MRYAEYRSASRDNPAGTGAAIATRPETRPIDLLREAARTDRYWVLRPEGDGTWTLRQLDGKTGLLGEAAHISGPIGDDPTAAADWARDLVEITAWHSMRQPCPGAFVDEVYTVVRELAYQARPGRSIVLRIETDPQFPGVTLFAVRERWADTDLESDPLGAWEYSGFADEEDLLRQVSGWFNLDPDGWTTVTPGVEWRHS
jgi:hypothetical protein